MPCERIGSAIRCPSASCDGDLRGHWRAIGGLTHVVLWQAGTKLQFFTFFNIVGRSILLDATRTSVGITARARDGTVFELTASGMRESLNGRLVETSTFDSISGVP